MLKIMSMLALLLATQLAHAQNVTLLSCPGNGAVADSQSVDAVEYSYKSKDVKTTTVTTNNRKPFSGLVTVEVNGYYVRMQLPPAFVPPFSDGNNAWYVVQNVNMTDREITGELYFNFMVRPDIRIDRMTGAITMAGHYADFTGQCAVVDTANGPRF